jgi:hypothetical protein
LLLAGFVLFGVAYGIYSRLLGWIDGLPQLPVKLLKHQPTGDWVIPTRPESPTQVKLARAFGARSPETDYALYETQMEFRTSDSSVVVAAGPVPANPESYRVQISPFSCAIFSKPKPEHLLQPGEVPEISTVHSDKAILEFDRIIHNANDIKLAKLVRLELISDFSGTFEDPRRGMIHITNNQRSDDPNRYVVIRTPGPVFYRDPKVVAGTPAAQGPDFWTDAPVEIVDRQNLPRPIGALAPATVASKSEDTRNPATVADILAARRSPPPTVTAIGFRLYLEQDTPGQPKKKNPNAPLQGVRRFEFLEQVVVNLWVDSSQTFMGGPAQPGEPAPSQNPPLALTPPPVALAAITGNLGPVAYSAKLQNRALLQIETRGPFAYDSEKGTARFDVVPVADPKLPNDVQVTKVSAREGTSSLFSQVLVLDLNGGPTSGAQPADAPAIKKIHAWTYTPGRVLTVTSQQESMQAYGQDLVHDQITHRTVLTGPELHVVRDHNELRAGQPQRPATLTSEPGTGASRQPLVTVRGPGNIKLFDASNGSAFTAEWQTSLVQTRETIGGREQDLFVFTDSAKFEDLKADYWLKGTVLKLWLEPQETKPVEKTANAPSGPFGSGQAKPAHIQAVGQVKSHSADYDIEQADQLNVFFEDAKVPAPAVAVAPPPPAQPRGGPTLPAPSANPSPASPAAAPPVAGPKLPAPAPNEPEKKPPMKIWAKDIQTWVKRVAVPPTVVAAKPEPPAPGMQPADGQKYQLDRVECEDNVLVQQAPTDPTKPRGIDIRGRKLKVDGSPDGNILTVYGWSNRPAEVHQEDISLVGPVVELDELHNKASVVGRGALTMPTNSDLSGGELKQPEIVVIHWRDKMDFRGALRSAEFEGKVSAQQGQSWVLCHTMHVTFDRPVYFNQVQRKAAPPKAIDPKNPNAAQNDKPKIDTVSCFPAAADSADDKRELFVHYQQLEFDPAGKMIKSQRMEVLELRILAQTQDPSGGEKYPSISALGPGKVYIWQPGDKDLDTPLGETNQPKQPMQPMQPMQQGPKPAPAREEEMKLTIVNFQDRMTAFDKGKVLQQATFTKDVKVISVPADSPNMVVDGGMLPPRAMQLTCKDTLIVGTYKKGNAAPVQSMDATGNAYLRTETYEGWAEKISLNDQLVVLTADKFGQARVKNRLNRGNDQIGRQITYDRSNGSFSVTGSYGGAINPKK